MDINGRRYGYVSPVEIDVVGHWCANEPGSVANPSVEVEQDMKRLILATVMACSIAMTLGAQGPGGRRPGPGMGPGFGMGAGGSAGGSSAVSDPAEFLLSQTGELKLTDAQVTRLAAIARRSAERRRALRAQMDSIRPEHTPGERPDSATRARMRQRFDQLRPQMEQLRTQSQADRRDAIAVLTADQQAQAWERIARMGRGGEFRGRGREPGRMQRGMRRSDRMRGQGFGPRRAGPPNDSAGTPGDGRRPASRRPEVQDSL